MTHANDCAFQAELGLTKREYFAAMAMQGLCANTEHAVESWSYQNNVANKAVAMADSLIQSLNETQQQD